jgi:50S ribosomal protein L16 3-hydroxylase
MSRAPYTVLRRLGTRSVAQFMREDWQRRPALLRGVFAPHEFAFAPQTLFDLARRDDVEARLVTRFGGRWRLRHGPVPANALPRQRARDWTLLVQGVNLYEPLAERLLARFRFLPDARLDDVMASYAVAGGGVGAHVDSYDVFLVQTRGRRRWRISRQRDQRLLEGAPLRLLAEFRPAQEWVLEPGDVLYLPPGIAHEGTALDDCITCSVGFRSLPWSALLAPLAEVLAARPALQQRYRDRNQRSTRAPARLPAAMERAFAAALSGGAGRADASLASRMERRVALLAALSEPKAGVYFEHGSRASVTRFAQGARRHGVSLDPGTRLLYAGEHAAINGEALALAPRSAPLVRRLADARALDAGACASLDEASAALLAQWYGAGWLHLGT